jgi:predicted nucleic acid-binding Zn finger protein
MQQLKIEHKRVKTTNNSKQFVSETKQKLEHANKREVKGAGLATSRNVYRLLGTDVYYVQSERSEEIYYYVKYNPSVFEWCSCPDNSIRGLKCKHLFAIEFAIKWGTIKEIDKLPIEAKSDNVIPTLSSTKSYLEDDYDF